MASIYKRTGSNYWWIKFRNVQSGKIVRESTGIPIDGQVNKRKAEELEAQKTLAEKQIPTSGTPGRWGTWVPDYIQSQVKGSTAGRYLIAWRTLRMFLDDQKVLCPAHLTYQHCSSYLQWRSNENQRQGKYRAGRNTAILEFKILRWLMREAIRRGYTTANPAREVVLKREPRKLFPDYTDQQLQDIYKAILREPEPNRTRFLRAFAVSLLHGVRLNETNVNPMTDVNLAAEIPTIRFLQKGGRERIKPLHPQLIALFKRLQEAKAVETYSIETVDGRSFWGNRWTKFWRRHKFKDTIPNACFHGLRVTVENVLREAGIEQRVREQYLTHEHGNNDVNARYDRVKIREMLACHTPLARAWLEV